MKSKETRDRKAQMRLLKIEMEANKEYKTSRVYETIKSHNEKNNQKGKKHTLCMVGTRICGDGDRKQPLKKLKTSKKQGGRKPVGAIDKKNTEKTLPKEKK